MRLHRLLLCTALLCASPAFAQPPGGGRGGPGRGGMMGGGMAGIGGLVAMEAVQKELGITDEQKESVKKIMDEVRSSFGSFNREEFADLSAEERTKRFEEMRKKGEETAQKVEEQVKGLLNEEQWTRLSELRIQREGVAALSRPVVAEQMSLTDEQKEKIGKLSESLRPGRGGRGGQGGERGERPNFEEMRAQREKTEGEIVALLTDEQKAKWEKLQGAKFEFPRPMFGGGAGGGERRRPNADNN